MVVASAGRHRQCCGREPSQPRHVRSDKSLGFDKVADGDGRPRYRRQRVPLRQGKKGWVPGRPIGERYPDVTCVPSHVVREGTEVARCP